jgi:predicted DNA-binding transcriptional regulator AlpA
VPKTKDNPTSTTAARLGQWLGFSDILEALGVTRRTLERWIHLGQFPAPLKFGGRVCRWRLETLQKFLADKEARIA